MKWDFTDFVDIIILGSYLVFFVLAWFGKIDGLRFVIGCGVSTVIGLTSEKIVEYLDEREGD